MKKQNCKIVYIDIGTHFAQEYSSIFGSHKYFVVKIFRRIVSYYLFSKGDRRSMNYYLKLFRDRSKLRSERENFKCYFVEANPKVIVTKDVYKKADGVFNIALTGSDKVDIINLFLANNDELSQGSSILIQKPNVSPDQYLATFGVPSEIFFKQLKDYLQKKYYEFDIILRLNCEGVEDDVIYAAHNVFSSSLKLIMGSLKDVRECKGETAYKSLLRYFDNNGIPFQFFSSSVNSWGGAFNAIRQVVVEAKT